MGQKLEKVTELGAAYAVWAWGILATVLVAINVYVWCCP